MLIELTNPEECSKLSQILDEFDKLNTNVSLLKT